MYYTLDFIIDAFLCGVATLFNLFIGVAGVALFFIILQGLVYRLSNKKINLYKKAMYLLFEKELKK